MLPWPINIIVVLITVPNYFFCLLKNYKTARCKAAMPILQVGMLLEQCR